MEAFMEFLNGVQGGALSIILIFLVITDTSLALKTRIPRGQFLSRRLLTGSGYNLLLSVIPLLCDILIKLDSTNGFDDTALRITMLLSFVVVGLGTLGSCMVNYSIAFPNATIAYKVVSKLLPKELETKVERLKRDEVTPDDTSQE